MVVVIISILSILMVLISVIYFLIGFKEKHAGIFIAGVLWIVGAALVYKFHIWWVAPIVLIAAILLNPNPEHS